MNKLPLLLLGSFALMAVPQSTPSSPLSAFPAVGFSEGRWDCNGAMSGGKRQHQALFQSEHALGGKWLRLLEQDVKPATGYQAEYLIGYDAAAGRLVEYDANNFGAASYSSTDGWKGNALTMTSAVVPGGEPNTANRFVYTVMSPDAFEMHWEVARTADLQWTVADQLTCKRLP